VEDVGIALGQALDQALGERRGIVRMADALVPLDEALASVAVDVSGRPFCSVEVTWTLERVGELPASLIEHLLSSIAAEAKLTLHARVLKGDNDHHRAEAMCKALGRALAAATRIEPRLQGQVPSTKGSIGKALRDLHGRRLNVEPLRRAGSPRHRRWAVSARQRAPIRRSSVSTYASTPPSSHRARRRLSAQRSATYSCRAQESRHAADIDRLDVLPLSSIAGHWRPSPAFLRRWVRCAPRIIAELRYL
jgi:hypothetical protein